MIFVRSAMAALGLYVCLAATIIHRHTAEWFGITVPWGLVLAVVVTYVVARAAETLVLAGAGWFAMGWAIGLMLPMLVSSGSYLIAADWVGVSFLAFGVGSLVLAAIRASRVYQ